MWASVCLALYVAFWLQLDNPFWAGTSAAIVCQPQLGASLRKGWFRMIGTLVGAAMSVLLTACFPQDRALFLGGLALWGAAATFVATLLRNFPSYAAALAGYTVAIIAGDLLGATGGVNADAAFLLAVYRASEICIGIVCAGVVLAGTDLGGAPRRLAALFAGLSAEIMSRFTDTLATSRRGPADTQVRREFLRRVIALEPIIDQSVGESSRLRYRSPVLQRAVHGLFAALEGWRTVANHLVRLPHDIARQEAAVILQSTPQELRSPPETGEPPRRIAGPAGLHRMCEAATRRLIALPAGTPSLRVLADKAAAVMAGMADAFDGLALLDDPARPVRRQTGMVRLRAPDWLPALVNGGRTLVVIGAVTLFWIVTVWPSGALAITFAAVTVILFGPQADQAYTAAVFFLVGSLLTAVLAAIIIFAVLPGLGTETFAGFSLVIAPCLVPIGALLAYARRPWQTAMFTAMTIQFVPLLQPTNPQRYDTLQFYNSALAIVVGSGVGAMSFRLLPPLSPAFRARRLLALTLRDLRRLATGHEPADWAGHLYGRLSAMPEEATPLQRALLLAALSVGREIIQLRHTARRLGLGAELDPALTAVARGNSAGAIAHLARLDAALAARGGAGPLMQTILRARGNILLLSEVLTQHGRFFDGGPGS